MTISATLARNDYSGSTSVGPYVYGFKVTAATDLQVLKRSVAGVETTLTYLNDYTVSGAGNDAGGSVTLLVAPLSTDVLTIRRALSITQPASIRNQGSYLPETIEDQLDRAVLIQQQQEDAIARSLKLPPSYNPTGRARHLVPTAGSVVVGDGTGFTTAVLGSTSSVALPGNGRTVATLSAYLVNNAVFNVKDYGAVCDGVTDDFAAINAAFAAVKAAGKGTVSFPPGVDFASSGMIGCATLTWADRIDDCTVEGNNARLILTSAASSGNIGLGLLGNRVTVRNLRAQPSVIPDYDLSSVRANSHMVYVGSVDNTTYATDVLIENVKVYGSYLHGITLANTERLTARQLVAQDCLGTGIFGGNHRGRVILDGIVTNRTRDDGVHQDNLVTTTPVTEGLTMANVQVANTYATGVRVSGTMRAALANIAVDNTRASAVSCLFGGYVSTVTSATNASPIVLGFASAHQFVAGDIVAVKGVLGNLGANGTWTVTIPDSTHITLTNSAGTGAWTSGGFATRQVGLAFSGVTLTRAGRNYGVGKFAGTGADTTVNASDCGGIVVLDGTTASITMDGVNLSVTEGIGISVATCTGLTITAPVLNMGQGPTSPAAYTAGISLGKAVDTTGEGVSDFTITAPVITSPSGSGIEAFNVKNGTVTAPVIRRWRAFGGAGVRRALDISGTRVWVDNPVLDDTAASGTPSNFSGNDVGFRRPIARVTTGSVGAGASADVTVAWGQTFSNTNYTVTATVVEATGVLVAKVKSLSTTGCVVTVTNSSGGALTGTIHAIATHD